MSFRDHRSLNAQRKRSRSTPYLHDQFALQSPPTGSGIYQQSDRAENHLVVAIASLNKSSPITIIIFRNPISCNTRASNIRAQKRGRGKLSWYRDKVFKGVKQRKPKRLDTQTTVHCLIEVLYWMAACGSSRNLKYIVLEIPCIIACRVTLGKCPVMNE